MFIVCYDFAEDNKNILHMNALFLFPKVREDNVNRSATKANLWGVKSSDLWFSDDLIYFRD